MADKGKWASALSQAYKFAQLPDLASSGSNDVSQGDQKPVMTVVHYCYLERHGSIKQAKISVNQTLSFDAKDVEKERKTKQAAACGPVYFQQQ